MNEIKKIIMEEIQNVVNEEVNLLKTKKLEKSLYEAVKTSTKLKQKALESKTPKDAKKYTNKYFISKRVVELVENKLANHHKKLNENTEGEGRMMKAQLRSIIDNATRIYHMIDETDNFEDWLQYKVTIAEDYLRAVNGYIKYYNGENHMKDDETDDDDIDGTKPNELEFELKIDGLGPGTLQCPETRKVKIQASEYTTEPVLMTKLW